MTINQGRHYPTNLMRCAARPPEQYGDVELSVQASRFHASDPRNGCGHTPLELYDRLEVALRWADARGRNRWIRQPSRELDIGGFDDLWCEEVPIAEYVPQDRVRALRAALVERARSQDGRAAGRAVDAELDLGQAVEEVDVDMLDISPLTTSVRREAELT
jgi:hypothetical protein